MSNYNPYASSSDGPMLDPTIRKVSVKPIELLKRAYALMGDQYWLFLGVTFVGIFLGSLVPFGILIGPFLVGIYLCFIQREQGQRVEFGTLFRGFDYFLHAFLATLVMIACSIVVMIPFIIFMMIAFFLTMADAPDSPSPAFFFLIVGIYLSMIIASMMAYIPFFFTFQLIADRKLSTGQAISMSWRGVQKNLWGILGMMIVLSFISLLLVIMCYLPLFFFLPVAIGAYFVLYRDIYGPSMSVIDPGNISATTH